MCAKIGGEPWALDKLPYMDDITMVCGMDVYHNTGKNSKSILAFCASVNDRATQYWSCVKVQENIGEELSNTLEEIMNEALIEFKKKNGKFPNKIIIYRDGVGNSQ